MVGADFAKKSLATTRLPSVLFKSSDAAGFLGSYEAASSSSRDRRFKRARRSSVRSPLASQTPTASASSWRNWSRRFTSILPKLPARALGCWDSWGQVPAIASFCSPAVSVDCENRGFDSRAERDIEPTFKSVSRRSA